jgi:hypothetical protein
MGFEPSSTNMAFVKGGMHNRVSDSEVEYGFVSDCRRL